MVKGQIRRSLFRLAYHGLYGIAIPVLSRTGPAEPALRTLYWRATRRPPKLRGITSPIDVDGLTIHHDPARPSYTIRGLAMGTYEHATVRLVQSLLRWGGSVIDLGAHVGYFSLLAASLVGEEGAVWAFEPDPGNREVLEKNIAANGFERIIEVSPLAVGAESGHALLYQYHSDGSSSSLTARYPDLVEHVAVSVEVATLDTWAEAHNWPAVDLIKMDIEGAEVGALSGMTNTLKRNPQTSLITEMNAEALSAGGGDPRSLLNALRDQGFVQIGEITPKGVRPIFGDDEIRRLVRVAMWEPVNLFCQQGAGREPA